MAHLFPNHAKIAVYTVPKDDRYAIQNRDGTTFYTFEAKFIYLLSEALNFSFLIMPSVDGTFGKLQENGSWSGLFGMLQREESDLAITYLIVKEERAKVVDFSVPYMFSDVTFLTHNPEPLPKGLAIFYPFQYDTWIAFGVLFFVATLLFYGFTWGTKSYQYVLLSVFGSVLEKELKLEIRSWSKRSFLLIWMASVMLLSYSYKGLILSFMTFPPTAGVRDIADLAKAVRDGSHICLTIQSASHISILLQSSNPDYRVIGKSLVENSKSDLDILNLMKIREPKSVVIFGRASLRVYKNNFYLSQSSFFTAFLAVGIRKSFCCKRKLDNVLRRIFEAGLYEKFFHDSDLVETLKLICHPASSENTHALDFDDLTGALALLIMGHSFALLVFIFELFIGKWHKTIKKI